MKRFFDNLLGRTSTKSISIVSKTHFDGNSLKKEINIDEEEKIIKEKLRRYTLENPKLRPFNRDDINHYKIIFELDLRKRPDGMIIGDLLDCVDNNVSYKAHTELNRHNGQELLSPEDDGNRTIYHGYLLYDWLEVQPYLTRRGEIDRYMWQGYINAFPISYQSIHELQDAGGKRSVQNQTIDIKEQDVNYYLQNIIKMEVRIFIRECLEIMSPRPR